MRWIVRFEGGPLNGTEREAPKSTPIRMTEAVTVDGAVKACLYHRVGSEYEREFPGPNAPFQWVHKYDFLGYVDA